MTTIIDGQAIAADIREGLSESVSSLVTADVQPTLATVLMSPDPASETYVEMKQRDCDELGIATRDIEIPESAAAERLFEAIDELNADEDIDGILVQSPTPNHVDYLSVMKRLDPHKDVDGFHPENVGLLVAGRSRFRPCTPNGIIRLLARTGAETSGADVTIVGRSRIVGKPLANLLMQKSDDGNATVTVCHSRSTELEEKVRGADIVIAACGVPEFIGRDMLTPEQVVIDVGINRVDADTDKGYELVGDVDFEAATGLVDAITPVPGGVGPMTRAMLLFNTVQAASHRSGIDVDLPTANDH